MKVIVLGCICSSPGFTTDAASLGSFDAESDRDPHSASSDAATPAGQRQPTHSLPQNTLVEPVQSSTTGSNEDSFTCETLPTSQRKVLSPPRRRTPPTPPSEPASVPSAIMAGLKTIIALSFVCYSPRLCNIFPLVSASCSRTRAGLGHRLPPRHPLRRPLQAVPNLARRRNLRNRPTTELDLWESSEPR